MRITTLNAQLPFMGTSTAASHHEEDAGRIDMSDRSEGGNGAGKPPTVAEMKRLAAEWGIKEFEHKVVSFSMSNFREGLRQVEMEVGRYRQRKGRGKSRAEGLKDRIMQGLYGWSGEPGGSVASVGNTGGRFSAGRVGGSGGGGRGQGVSVDEEGEGEGEARETLIVCCCLTLQNIPDSSVMRSNPRDSILQVSHAPLVTRAYMVYETLSELTCKLILKLMHGLVEGGKEQPRDCILQVRRGTASTWADELMCKRNHELMHCLILRFLASPPLPHPYPPSSQWLQSSNWSLIPPPTSSCHP